MSDFCRHHGFYAPCPSCTGEEVIWEIPVVDCAGTGGVDVFRVSAGVYEDAMAGAQTVHTPAPAEDFRRFSASSPQVESPRLMPAARDHIPLPVNPGLYARVKTILQRHQ